MAGEIPAPSGWLTPDRSDISNGKPAIEPFGWLFKLLRWRLWANKFVVGP